MMVSFKTKSLLAGLMSALALSVGTLPAFADNSSSETSTVTVKVTGFEAEQGFVMAALVDADGYKGGKPVAARRADVTGDTVTLTFENLPSGEYAIRMFHDVNSDGTLNMNDFGMPLEPFAFSNNATGMMGPAPWSKAKFNVSDDVVQNISF